MWLYPALSMFSPTHRQACWGHAGILELNHFPTLLLVRFPINFFLISISKHDCNVLPLASHAHLLFLSLGSSLPPACKCSFSLISIPSTLSQPPLLLVPQKQARLVRSTKQLFTVPGFAPHHGWWLSDAVTYGVEEFSSLTLVWKNVCLVWPHGCNYVSNVCFIKPLSLSYYYI